MVVPDRNPSEALEAGNGVEVGTVAGVALAVVVEGARLDIGLRSAADGVAPAVCALGILVDKITEMENVVYGLLSCGVAKGVEEAEG